MSDSTTSRDGAPAAGSAPRALPGSFYSGTNSFARQPAGTYWLPGERVGAGVKRAGQRFPIIRAHAQHFQSGGFRDAECHRPAAAVEPRDATRLPTARAEPIATFECDAPDPGGHLRSHHHIGPLQMNGSDDRLIFR